MTNNPNDAPGLGGGGALPGPGSTLDQLICKKFGYELVKRPNAYGGIDSVWVEPATGDDVYFHGWWPEPAYSTDMNAAWMLVEFIIEKYPKTDFNLKHDFYTKKPYRVSFEIISEEVPYEIYKGEADTAPHAICLAFLALPDEVVRGEE